MAGESSSSTQHDYVYACDEASRMTDESVIWRVPAALRPAAVAQLSCRWAATAAQLPLPCASRFFTPDGRRIKAGLV